MKALCVAIVAEKGAGKGHFVEATKRLLPEKRVASIRFSDPVRAILEILNKEITREHMQSLATTLRYSFNDEGILNKAMQKYISETTADIILLDGLRKREEALFVRELGGTLVYIVAHPRVRFERRKRHVENLDEPDMSWEQFLEQDNAATEISIREIGESMARIRIENNGTLEEFEQSIKRAWMHLTLP